MANPPPTLRRRWVQFSLRTGLIFVTLLCVALSMWVVPLEQKRRAIAAIEELGGTVVYIDREATGEPYHIPFLRRWLPAVYFDEIKEVYLSNSEVTDAGLAHLQGLTSLQGLDLENTKVTDAGLAHLQRMTNLLVLSLDETQVTDAGLTHLKGVTNLRAVSLYNTKVTVAGLGQLQQSLPNCQITGP